MLITFSFLQKHPEKCCCEMGLVHSSLHHPIFVSLALKLFRGMQKQSTQAEVKKVFRLEKYCLLQLKGKKRVLHGRKKSGLRKG